MTQEVIKASEYEVLAAGNSLAKQYAESVGGSHIALRQFLTGRPISESDKARFQSLSISETDLAVIVEAERLRDRVHAQYQPLLIGLARQIGRNREQFDDLAGEGQIFLIEVIYGYTRPNIKFLTYATVSLKRMYRRYALQKFHSEGLSSNSSEFLDLLRAYSTAERELLSQGSQVTYHNVVEHLGLDDASANKLLGIMARVSSTSANAHDGSVVYNEGLERIDDLDAVFRALETSSVSPLEKDVISAFLGGSTVEQIAEAMSIPRENVLKLLNRAKKKVQRVALAA